jgi:N-formylglutamate amidohydrolase
MFALVEDGSITKYFSGNRGITLGSNQYPKAIFTLWTKSEREAIGIYEVVWDNSKKKDEEWYTNTNVSYAFAGGKVTASYGDATAKAHADTLFTAQDESDGKGTEGEVAAEGLKTIKIRNVKKQAAGILAETDWYIVRKADADTAIPSAITNHRAAVRTKCAQMETAITNASNTAALETLYTYTKQEDGSVTRPLGNLPTLEV